jgi:hypothetical protein
MRLSCLVLSLALAGIATAEPVKVTPGRNWVAVVNDETKKKEAPKDGLITDAKAFEKLWKSWRKDEKVPEVDFKKQFVVVTLASGPNKPGISAVLDEGNLKILARQTLIGGDGFGYSIATFDRKGVKKVNGKELPEK